MTNPIIAKAIKSPPKEIWLQWDNDPDERTWCEDNQNESDVKYVRADLLQTTISKTIESIEGGDKDEELWSEGIKEGKRQAKESVVEETRKLAFSAFMEIQKAIGANNYRMKTDGQRNVVKVIREFTKKTDELLSTLLPTSKEI
jgi:hypothetical protein